MPLVLIGLTGGIACGKSTVSSILANDYHIPIIDADLIVRDLQRPHAPCTRKIAQRWPSCVDSRTGELNRKALGQVVFSDPTARRELAKVMSRPIFVAILRRILHHWWRALWSTEPVVVVLDAPTLFETRLLTAFVSSTVVVSCSAELQVERLVGRDGMTREAALARIESQMPLEKKRALAGRVVHNDVGNDLPALRRSVSEAVEWMTLQSAHRLTLLIVGAVTGCIGVVALVGAAVRTLLA